jgi:hypothetical protein
MYGVVTLQQVLLKNHVGVNYIVNCKDCVYIFDKKYGMFVLCVIVLNGMSS